MVTDRCSIRRIVKLSVSHLQAFHLYAADGAVAVVAIYRSFHKDTLDQLVGENLSTSKFLLSQLEPRHNLIEEAQVPFVNAEMSMTP